jgi:hypothetical protein
MERMHRLAGDIREAFSDRGYKIEQAIQSDHAFGRTRHPQSTMVRSLVLDAIEHSAARIGLGIVPVVGGGYDVQDVVGMADRRFRVLKAVKNRETGEYEIVCKSDAVLTITDAEPESIFTHERRVLAYTVDDAGMVVDIFSAPVEGITDDIVPRLRIGPITPLGSALPFNPESGFQPNDDDDLGFGDELFDDDVETGEAK